MYSVKEIFFTIQGEGCNTGSYAVFCRFSGCNLWTGREKDRKDSICNFCDTDFIGTDGLNGGKYKNPQDLASKAYSLWRGTHKPFIVLTGGEPLLQVNEPLIKELHRTGFTIALETNGTIKAPNDIDWICVSPKENSELAQDYGDELKLVYPQKKILPKDFEKLNFKNFLLQPMDGPQVKNNTIAARKFCDHNNNWKLSLQTHKVLGYP
jgi:7-carboxy-7-deazaguanine synthase